MPDSCCPCGSVGMMLQNFDVCVNVKNSAMKTFVQRASRTYAS
ncbi:hypothetical protein SJ05684_c01420 [Sinorhizobium sojae CCBAU 05684]|uniref:Uncharacterized protein n=1 Tax=Sinorhizobium sojae CCBAU 05684 TaxID=716928 RepID=A0A249P7A7_9HYPH|nr:hypothetical protein SJ05684_c01420 [Sinorhizobium sojae CCBAU 05684]